MLGLGSRSRLRFRVRRSMVGFSVSLGFGVKGLGFEGFGGLEVKGLE